MDPTISPPTDELRQRISSALESYRSKLYKINYEKLRSAVHDTNVRFDAYLSAPSEEEQADSIEERIASFEDQYLVGEYGGDPPELEDLVTNIDDLLDPDTARRILPNVINPPVTPEVCEQRMREIESEVQAQAAAASYDRDGGSDSNVALPNEYRVLMSLCDGILPSGLHSEVDSRSVVAIRGLAATQVPPLDELKQRLRLEQVGYIVHAGFITEPYSDGERACAGWALCERAATEDARERRKAWRIVFALQGDDCPFTYDSVEEFLRWYAGYDVRRYGSWDYENGVYLDGDGNPVDDQ